MFSPSSLGHRVAAPRRLCLACQGLISYEVAVEMDGHTLRNWSGPDPGRICPVAKSEGCLLGT